LSLLMIRFRAGDDVSALVEELHGDSKEKTIRIRKKVGSKFQISTLDPFHGRHAYRYFGMLLSTGIAISAFSLGS